MIFSEYCTSFSVPREGLSSLPQYPLKLLWGMSSEPTFTPRVPGGGLHETVQQHQGESFPKAKQGRGHVFSRDYALRAQGAHRGQTFPLSRRRGAAPTAGTARLRTPLPPPLPSFRPRGPPSHFLIGCPAGCGHTPRALGGSGALAQHPQGSATALGRARGSPLGLLSARSTGSTLKVINPSGGRRDIPLGFVRKLGQRGLSPR